MIDFGTSRLPSFELNSFFLEPDEIQLIKLKVNLKIEGYLPISGFMHLCTRSFIFCPSSYQNAILRGKYSDGLALKLFRNMSTTDLYQLLSSKISINQLRQYNKNHAYQKSLIRKNQLEKLSSLFNLAQTLIKHDQKHYFIINCQKTLFTIRSNLTPYQVIYSFPWAFAIDDSQSDQSIWQAIRIYHFCNNINLKQHLIVSKILNQRIKKQFKNSQNIYQCCQIKIDSNSYGTIQILQNKIKYSPLVNVFYQQPSSIIFSNIKYIKIFRYQFKYDSIQIWTYQHKYSRLFKFNSQEQVLNIFNIIFSKCQFLNSLCIQTVQKQWVENQISNYDYLMFLNIQANRSFNDISQYPVFPWIIHEYGTKFDVNDKTMFRNLSLPIGVINKHRNKRLKVKQEELQKYIQETVPLYRIHYSLPCNIKYFLIRKIPSLLLRLQQQAVVPPDRVFVGVEQAYYNTLNGAGDFKQCIPQFYQSSQDIFVNSYGLPLGKNKHGQTINNASLPSWAKTPLQLSQKLKQALQSQYVQQNIHNWIDLIFGFKQKGYSSIKHENNFDKQFFQQNYDNKNIKYPIQQNSHIQILARKRRIRDFGQMPLQLFTDPHPKIHSNNKSKQQQLNKLGQIKKCLTKLQQMMEYYPQANSHLLNLQQIVQSEQDKIGQNKSDSSLGSAIKADLQAIDDFFNDDFQI